MKFLVAVCCLLVLSAVARPQSTPPQASSRAQKRTKPAPPATPDEGEIVDGLYRNRPFGLSYKIPFGWVDRTDQMQDTGDPAKSMVLLAVFERPPEVASQEINPAIVVAAESVTSYPGLKTAADYLGSVSEVALSKGFKVANEPYEFSAGGMRVVREDFSKEKAYQSSLAWLHKGYVVSATFIGADEDDVEKIIEGLKPAASARR